MALDRMAFRHIIESISRNGAKETHVRDIDKVEIAVGRSSASDIFLDSPLVSLNHAKLLVMGDGSLVIEDANSLSGVYVNGRVTRHEPLRAGDTVRLGDVSLEVVKDQEGWAMREVRKAVAREDSEQVIARQLRSLTLANNLPSHRALSLFLVVVVMLVFLVLPLYGKDKMLWSSGPIANSHRIIEKNCEACHREPNVQVRDQECLTCHNMGEHAKAFEEKHPGLERRCAQCHMEHNGDAGLIARDSNLCIECHQDIKSRFANALAPNISSFAGHPEFHVDLLADDGSVSRVKLDDTAKLKDPTHLKLNHKIHLEKDIRGSEGPTTLQCQSCHRLAADFRTIEPIEFERDCESCHSLEFDDRLPGVEVPHGRPEVVYKFLYAEYAKHFLASSTDPTVREKFGSRQRPGETSPAEAADAAATEDFTRAFVSDESRRAEQEIFTKTACFLCHEVTEKTVPIEELNKNAETRFDVVKPRMPARWMSRSIFGHGAHEAVQCEACHQGVSKSEETSDVLLPKIKECRACHEEHGSGDTVKSECVVCHSYHEPEPIEQKLKHSIDEVLGLGK